MRKFIFTIVGVGILLGFGGIAEAQQNGVLYFSPSTKTLIQGESLTVDVFVDTKGQFVNTVGIYFPYSEDKIEVLSIAIVDPEMIVFQKDFANGAVGIAIGKGKPGFSGVLKLASIVLRSKVSSGSAILTFSQDSGILLNSNSQNIMDYTLSGKLNLAFQSALVPTATPKATATASPSLPKITPRKPAVSSFIDSIKIETIDERSAVISWTTDQESISHIAYGTSSDYERFLLHGEMTTAHRVSILDLEPSTKYFFRIIAKDTVGTVHQSEEFNFETEQSKTITPSQVFQWFDTLRNFFQEIFADRTVKILGAALVALLVLLIILKKRDHRAVRIDI